MLRGVLCRGKDQRFFPLVLHRTDDAAEREVDDEVDNAGGTEQDHDVGNIHGAQTDVGDLVTQQLADAGQQLDGGHV